jgi:predicted HTH transcriptional regulator
MVPLDASATTMKAASAFANENVPNVILGVHSIG